MRLFTANGMDVKVMKGCTNPSKQDVQRWPSEKVRVSPTGRVYEYCFKSSYLSILICKVGQLCLNHERPKGHDESKHSTPT
jgi:hypothetical protein